MAWHTKNGINPITVYNALIHKKGLGPKCWVNDDLGLEGLELLEVYPGVPGASTNYEELERLMRNNYNVSIKGKGIYTPIEVHIHNHTSDLLDLSDITQLEDIRSLLNELPAGPRRKVQYLCSVLEQNMYEKCKNDTRILYATNKRAFEIEIDNFLEDQKLIEELEKTEIDEVWTASKDIIIEKFMNNLRDTITTYKAFVEASVRNRGHLYDYRGEEGRQENIAFNTARKEFPKIENRIRDFNWSMRETAIKYFNSPFEELQTYIREKEDKNRN